MSYSLAPIGLWSSVFASVNVVNSALAFSETLEQRTASVLVESDESQHLLRRNEEDPSVPSSLISTSQPDPTAGFSSDEKRAQQVLDSCVKTGGSALRNFLQQNAETVRAKRSPHGKALATSAIIKQVETLSKATAAKPEEQAPVGKAEASVVRMIFISL